MKQSISDYKQSMYDFFYPLASFAAVCVIIYALLVTGILTVQPIRAFDLIIVALASFRLTRLFCYDSIFRFLREFLVFKSKVIVGEDGEKYIEKTPVGVGIRRTIFDIFDCSWCMGMWTTLLAALLYTLTPATALLVVVIAIAGVASFFQSLSRLIGNKSDQLE